jgi:hypothetical protein
MIINFMATSLYSLRQYRHYHFAKVVCMRSRCSRRRSHTNTIARIAISCVVLRIGVRVGGGMRLQNRWAIRIVLAVSISYHILSFSTRRMRADNLTSSTYSNSGTESGGVAVMVVMVRISFTIRSMA